MKLLSIPFAIIALSTVALSVGCGKSDDTGGDDTGIQTTDTGTQTTDTGTPIVDADSDGVAFDDDCDDNDATLGAVADDGDCDGWLTADDCDDGDSSSTIVSEDGDCDGVLTAEDCDDADESSTIVAEDGDCDGTLTADDCDDGDASLNAGDVDNDGYSTCDGDCDDDDASLEIADIDNDGYSTCDDDCDDQNSKKNPGATDGLLADLDCDGIVTGGSLSLSDYKLLGEDKINYAGISVSSAGDVDGDGLDDVLVGAPYNEWSDREGAAYIILGSSLGTNSTIDLSTADYKFVGEESVDYAGRSVASAGDVDGDGLDDVLVSAYMNDDAFTTAGAVYIILASSLGTNSTIDLSNADYKLLGEDDWNYAGISVSSAGDVDGDGLDDVLVGANKNDEGGSEAGAAYVILGSSLGTNSTISLSNADYKLVGESADSDAGISVSSAGDVDGDGLDDILVGAYKDDEGGSEAGAAYVILGSSLGTSNSIDLSTADYKLVGESGDDFAGYSVSSAGDLDGDGLDDVLVGAFGDDDGGSDAGAAYVILGSSLGTSRTIDLSTADYKLLGESADDYTGRCVSSAGDVDGDGLDDVLVGSYGNDEGGSEAGAAYVILGSSLGTSSTIDLSNADFKLVGISVDQQAGGWSLSLAGDVNGDGKGDVLVGAVGDGDNGLNAGAVYLILTGE